MARKKSEREVNQTNAAEFAGGEKTRSGNLVAVGVGASAGGLEAFTELLTHLPADTGMAFILVQHLDPHHDSALPEILASKTQMPVLQVHNHTRIAPNCVYVNPPNAVLQVQNGTLTLQARPESAERFKPIDAFFSSLAQEFRYDAVGIILSGTATDGTFGLKNIKGEGGITFAQNQTAKFDSMPRSAIAAGVVDFILTPRRIAEELAAIARRTPQLNSAESELTRDGTTLRRLLLLMRNNTGVDFTQYKEPTVLRRLSRRMLVRKSETLAQYFEVLQNDSKEIWALFDDLLINVTDFFRDPEVFEAAKRLAFTSWIKDRKPPYNLRVWIPGCSSGEEVYSMAISLVEFMESEALDYTLRLFGTDVSESAIDRARAGVYSEGSLAKVSPERIRRFFVRNDAAFRISPSIREMCVFSRHNVTKDPALSRMNLISCRNLLIYLSSMAQRRILSSFLYSLQPGGCLILGASESLGSLSDYFETVDEPNKIYCKKTRGPEQALPLFEAHDQYEHPQDAALPAPRMDTPASNGPIHHPVNKILLSRYQPAGIVADETLKVVEYRGELSQYLAALGNQPGADLMTVVREELRAPLSAAVERARRTNDAVMAENAPGSSANWAATLAISVIPLALAGNAPQFLILFGERGEKKIEGDASQAAGDGETVIPPPGAENARLKEELQNTRAYLQSVIEELRSTNEEAQSANEELQSTNEEIQTSKEEMQSSNEELNTINAEMQSRNSELARTNDDLVNLLGSMNMPILMTGSDLCIRRFSPTAEKVLRLISADIGRPITDLKPRIDVPNLEEILHHVLDSLQPYEKEVQDVEGRQYLMRVRPYRTSDNRIDGTVLQLLDVSDLKRSLEEVKNARDYAETIVNTVSQPLLVLDGNLAIQDANSAFYDMLDLPGRAAHGQNLYQVGQGRFNLPAVRALLEGLAGDPSRAGEVEIEHRAENGETRFGLFSAHALKAPGQQQRILVAIEDITERKRAAEARYRRVFESARDGIVLADAASGQILDVNPFAERLLGYSRQELIGRQLWESDPLRNIPNALSLIQQISEQGVMRFFDLSLKTKEGHELETEIIANVYSEAGRRAIQFNIRDVSERKKFERELQETQKLESLGLLAGGIAHDFNNLLTGIIGNASLATTEIAADQPVRMRLSEIIRAGERAAFLTRQMLAYAGKGRFVVEAIDLGDLISEISALVRLSIPKFVDLKLDLAPDLPQIDADPAQIQQVVMNLVINGAEAIGENTTGKVEVRTSLRELNAREAMEFFGTEQASGKTYVQIEVSDNGSGMDEATKARIFDPFFTTKFTGRGLGLAAVQGIVKGHNGAIRVHSVPGQGTTFTILLPAERQRALRKPPEEPRSVLLPSGTVALVIDDDDTIRQLATNVLSRKGVKVLAAANGKEGVEMFQEHNAEISVVVLDLLMPVMGGEAVLPRLMEINPGIPVILSSGFDETEARRRFSELKPARFLQKPYTARRLAEAIADTLAAAKPAVQPDQRAERTD